MHYLGIMKQVCGVVNGKINEELGAFNYNDFESWQPDVIVVNLGTNDGGAFTSPEWIDETTKESFKQHIDDDGNYNKNDIKRFENAIIKFLCKIRKNNRKAKIVWAYGMLGTPMMKYIYRSIEKYQNEFNDDKVFITQLPNTTEETVGARKHPGKLNHEIAANQLWDFIRNL